MSLVYADRVQETSTTTGTGTYTLAGAVTGFQGFSAVGDANTCYYCAQEVDVNGNPSGGWEVGLGTYTAAGGLLARTTILASSNGGAAVNWAAGTRRIFVVVPAAIIGDFPFANIVQIAATTILGNATSGTADIAATAISDGETLKRVGTTMSSARFGPASITLLTSGAGATYTVPAGIYRLRVRVQGPGGGGGGCAGTTAGVSAGGGSGGYAEKVISTTPGATFTYTIGVGGAGGAAGNNAGSNGSTATVWDSGGTPVTGNVGVGGGSMATGTSLNAATPGAGGTATGGTLNITGMSGGTGVRYSGSVFVAGAGADSLLGAGGVIGLNGTGGAATVYGAGGGGTFSSSGVASQAGGAGSDGVIIVEEFN